MPLLANKPYFSRRNQFFTIYIVLSSFHPGCALVDTVAVPPEGPPAPQRCPNEHMSSDADVAGIGAAAEENGAFFLDTEPEARVVSWFRNS